MRFEYLQPADTAECLRLLDTYGTKAKIMAGGTDLMIKARARVVDPDYVIDIGDLPALRAVSQADGELRIGAAVTVADLSRSPLVKERFPLLATAAGLIGSVGIRNVATIGGNLCNASPSAECAPALLCLAAELAIMGPRGERRLPIGDFFLGPGRTALASDELLSEIYIPFARANVRGVYLKSGPRGSVDLATVGVAALGRFGEPDGVCQEVSIALGAVAPIPMRATEAEQMLIGRPLDSDLIARAAFAAAQAARPIDDVRASADYRREMVQVFTRRALTAIAPS